MTSRPLGVTIALLLATAGCLGFAPLGNAESPTPTPPTPDPTPMADPTQSVTATTTAAGTPTLTGTPTVRVATDATTPTPTATPTVTVPGEPFNFTIAEMTACGQTCRTVRAVVTNDMRTTATNVSVAIRTFAGNETDGDPVWTNTTSVGDLEPGEVVTIERDVVLSLGEALSISNHDGWVAIEATITSEDESMTTIRLRNVE